MELVADEKDGVAGFTDVVIIVDGAIEVAVPTRGVVMVAGICPVSFLFLSSLSTLKSGVEGVDAAATATRSSVLRLSVALPLTPPLPPAFLSLTFSSAFATLTFSVDFFRVRRKVEKAVDDVDNNEGSALEGEADEAEEEVEEGLEASFVDRLPFPTTESLLIVFWLRLPSSAPLDIVSF